MTMISRHILSEIIREREFGRDRGGIEKRGNMRPNKIYRGGRKELGRSSNDPRMFAHARSMHVRCITMYDETISITQTSDNSKLS